MLAVRKYQSGVSLIELMVSILIASFVLSGVVGVVFTSRQSFVNEQEASIMQENARFAMSLVTRDIRMAGTLGCAPRTGAWGGAAFKDDTSLMDVAGISGYGADPTWASNSDAVSDAVIIRYADPAQSIPIKNHSLSGSTNAFELHLDGKFAPGDKLAVIDSSCRHFAIFEADSNTTTTNVGQAITSSCATALFADRFDFTCDSPSNSNAEYRPGSVIYPYRISGYFIGESDITPGMPALKRQMFSSEASSGQRSEELAQGIEYLELQYGIDSTPDEDNPEVDTFVDAASVEDWEHVLAVKMTFVLRSQQVFFDSANTFSYGDFSKTDRYLRRALSSTVTIRSRVRG